MLAPSRVRYGVEMPAFIGFFFSSRRRHTRSLRDWSSDVCSSDLPEGEAYLDFQRALKGLLNRGTLLPRDRARRASGFARSEERRVGKECRSRGVPCREKKK